MADAAGLEAGDVLVGVDHLNVGGTLDVRCGYLANARTFDAADVRAFSRALEPDFLQIQNQLHDILNDAVYGGVFVWNALNLDGRDRRAGKRRQQDAPKRVAEGRAVATFERLGEKAPVVVA